MLGKPRVYREPNLGNRPIWGTPERKQQQYRWVSQFGNLSWCWETWDQAIWFALWQPKHGYLRGAYDAR